MSRLDDWLDDPNRPPLLMGVLNVTPDSFSDGGLHLNPDDAVRAALAMIDDDADVIDVGGESTRPGSARVDPDEQMSRTRPVIERIRTADPDIPISVDTGSAQVAEAALDAGADLINDVYAGRDDARMLPLAAERAAPICLMHMLGTPATMQQSPGYDDVTASVAQFLLERRAATVDAGVPAGRVLLDPGIGFGKTLEHNLQLLRDLPGLKRDLDGAPLLLGVSRKRFIGELTGVERAEHRQFGTAAAVAWCVASGADLLRVHDVREMRQVVDVARRFRNAR